MLSRASHPTVSAVAVSLNFVKSLEFVVLIAMRVSPNCDG